jgi:hypothetical protein
MNLLSRGLIVVVLLLGALAFACPSLAAPLSVYGRLPMIEDAQISPDGSMMAYAVTNGDARLVMIKTIDTGDLVTTLNAGDKKVRDIQWATSGYLLVSISSTTYVPGLAGPKREYVQVLSYDLASKKTRLLMEKAPDAMNVVIGRPMVRMLKGEPHVIVEGVHWVGQERGRNSLFVIRLPPARPGFMSSAAPTPPTGWWPPTARRSPRPSTIPCPANGACASRRKTAGN